MIRTSFLDNVRVDIEAAPWDLRDCDLPAVPRCDGLAPAPGILDLVVSARSPEDVDRQSQPIIRAVRSDLQVETATPHGLHVSAELPPDLAVMRRLFVALTTQFLWVNYGCHCWHAASLVDSKRNRLLVISGESGSGKTSVAEWLSRHSSFSLLTKNYLLQGADGSIFPYLDTDEGPSHRGMGPMSVDLIRLSKAAAPSARKAPTKIDSATSVTNHFLQIWSTFPVRVTPLAPPERTFEVQRSETSAVHDVAQGIAELVREQ